MPLSDAPRTEEDLYQEFLVWKQGMGFGGPSPWNMDLERAGGTQQGLGLAEAGGGSATLARGAAQAGGGAGSQLLEDFNAWLSGLGQQGLGATTGRPRGAQDLFAGVPSDLDQAMAQMRGNFRDPDVGGGVIGALTGPTAQIGPATAILGRAALGGQFGIPPLTGGLTGPGALGSLTGAGLQVAGLGATALGAPPEVGFGLGQAGNIAGGVGAGASIGALAAGLSTPAALAPALIGGGLGAGTLAGISSATPLAAAGLSATGAGAASAGGAAGLGGATAGLSGAVAGGLAALPVAVGLAASAWAKFQRAQEAAFNLKQNRRILSVYEPGDIPGLVARLQEGDRSVIPELQRSLQASVYTKVRLARHGDLSVPYVEQNLQGALRGLYAVDPGLARAAVQQAFPGVDTQAEWNQIRGLPSARLGPTWQGNPWSGQQRSLPSQYSQAGLAANPLLTPAERAQFAQAPPTPQLKPWGTPWSTPWAR